MSLPTPPSTSHREKENIPSGARVVWSQSNQYHCLTSPPRFTPIKVAAATPKSILKKRELTLPAVANTVREATPEPSDPLVDLTYLQSSVSKIIALETPLRELVEAYSILAARLRSCVGGLVDGDSSWPLFQPLRQNRDAITEAIVRDLGKALEEPPQPEEEAVEEIKERCSLPSPVKSPRKKGGLTAEQVKRARDLCHTCHAVIRCLAFVFTTPALYSIFTEYQLGSIMTQLLAIPIADSLPTPNSRKTCALAIWLISTQRLPSEVLLPARDRIAYALRRGIDGELGKEGKKGSVSDGLKAIHDLSLHQPETFVPAFAELLPSVLSCVLGPTLTLRIQACHALGGFAYASTTIPRGPIHTRISTTVADFLTEGMTTVPTASPAKKSPSKDPPLIRALRTTLVATDPQHSAQGPVWALCVLANLIILIGPALYTSARLERTIRAMLSVAMRTKRSSVRALLCLVWRCLTWVYFQPPLLPNPDSESEVEDSDDEDRKKPDVQSSFWDLLVTSKDMGCGVNLVCALLADPDARDEDHFERAFGVLKAMLSRGGLTREDAMQVLRRLVSFDVEPDAGDAFELNKLLPKPLFSANPGLLTTDYKSLASVVKPIFALCPQVDAIAPLSRDEISREWIFDELLALWKQGFGYIEMPDEADPPDEIVATWDAIVKANVAFLQDTEGDEATTEFTVKATDVLIELLGNSDLDVRVKAEVLSPGPPASSPVKRVRKPVEVNHRSSPSLLLTIVQTLWISIRTTVPRELLEDAGKRLLSALWENEDRFSADAHDEWSELSADILIICEDESVLDFWQNTSDWTTDACHTCWTIFADKWRQDAKASWDGAIKLLGLPFASAKTWKLSETDVELWENLLTFAVNSALDYGHEAVSVLDRVARHIARAYDPSSPSIVRAVDVLLSQVNMPEIRSLPSNLFQIVNDALLASYPPEPRNLVHAGWLLRTLTNAVEQCPVDMLLEMLEAVGEGVATWVSDEHTALPLDDYSYNVVTLFEMVLASIQPLPAMEDTIGRLAPILESTLKGRRDKPASMLDALRDLWRTNWSSAVPVAALPHSIQVFLGLIVDIATEGDEAEPEDDATTTASSTTFTFSLKPAFFSPAPSSMPATPVRPSTSRRMICPQILSSALQPFQFFPLQSPSSPYANVNAVPSTPTRTPLLKNKRLRTPGSAFSPSSSKRRKLDHDKENTPVIASVMSRILDRTPVFSKPEKRPMADDVDDEPVHRVLKKSKSFPPSRALLDEGEEHLVESQLLPSINANVFVQRRVMESVIPPTLGEVFPSRVISFSTPRASISHPSLRMSRSTCKTSRRRLDLHESGSMTPTPSFMTKLLGSASPLPEMSVPGSDDSIMGDQFELNASSSSDIPSDDGFIGVVTPHRLISPAPRRASYDEDPPSDDSNPGSSPTRHVAARRLSRQNSLQQPNQARPVMMIAMEDF